jgi:hypothetical protein
VIHPGSDASALEAALSGLDRRWGPREFLSPPLPFDKTSYYDAEMGGPLSRVLWMSGRLFDRGDLAGIKIETNAIEASLSRRDGTRRVNIDPGFLTAENFILATTKNYSHRVYLGRGIFGDLTLVYSSGEYRPLKWTYPDYAGDEIRNILKTWRVAYNRKIKDGIEWPCSA